MEKNPASVNIYIDSAKPFYYPGEKFLASILLDVLENVKCYKMIVTAKGKQLIKANQKIDPQVTVENAGEYSDDDDDWEPNAQGMVNEINKTTEIFKWKKAIQISNNNYLSQGKYKFPIEVELPEDIPGSFLFMDSKAYAEIIYSFSVKLHNINIKERVPIIIRQKKEVFNYPLSAQYNKKLGGCCCETGEVTIHLDGAEPFTLNGNELKVHVTVDNTHSGSTGTPINVEIYQKIILKDRNKVIRITKMVGAYKGKRMVIPRTSYNKNLSLLLDTKKYVSENLSKTKAIKYFRHSSVIPLLNQSIKTKNITNEYEVYAESQFSNLTVDEIGVFLSVLIYPPEKSILSKTVSNISQEFSNSAINNKKIFLNENTSDNINDYGKKEKKKPKQKKQEKEFDDNQSEESIKNYKKTKKPEKEEFENINKSKNNKNINNINEMTERNFQKSNMMSDEISFGTSTKDRINVYSNTNNVERKSNNIKKELNHNFLNDPLDADFNDMDSMN